MANARLASIKHLNMTLECLLHTDTRSGKSGNVLDIPLWSATQAIAGPFLLAGAQTLVPVHFDVPSDCRETTSTGWDRAVRWRLLVATQKPEPAYEAEFEVPVFDLKNRLPQAGPR